MYAGLREGGMLSETCALFFLGGGFEYAAMVWAEVVFFKLK